MGSTSCITYDDGIYSTGSSWISAIFCC